MNTINASSLDSSAEEVMTAAPLPMESPAAAAPSYWALAGKILLGIALAVAGLVIGLFLGFWLGVSAGWLDVGC